MQRCDSYWSTLEKTSSSHRTGCKPGYCLPLYSVQLLAASQANAGQHDDEMADGLTIEDVQNEAAAKQRAFESNQAEPSTSGRGNGTGELIAAFLPCL